MKKLLATLMLFPTISLGQHKNEVFELCTAIEGLSRSVMDARQSGAPMSAMVEASNGNPMARSLVFWAFEKPIWGTEERKREEARSFSEAAFRACHEMATEKGLLD